MVSKSWDPCFPCVCLLWCFVHQKSNGVRSSVTGDSMTRAPALRMPSAQRAGLVALGV